MRTALLTLVALLAFAANSVLCRLALADARIDPATFTLVRIASGALTLALVVLLRGRATASVTADVAAAGAPARGAVCARDLVAAGWLFVYAAMFSFAYLDLGAGTGALILFGCVQLTMILAGLRGGERPPARAWAGILLALGGLVVLVAPGLAAPDPAAAARMAVAGVAWGAYSLRGRTAADPLRRTAANFLGALPAAALLALACAGRLHGDARGLALAVASGALASGLGYVVWYAALRGLTAVRAATVQLAVPVLAAFGGIALLGEALTPRLAGSSVVILGGIALALHARAARPAP